MSEARSYGLIAMFDRAEALLAAAREARAAGYRRLDAFSPFPLEGLAEAIGFKSDRLPWVILICALAGGVLGYLLQWYSAVIDYPFNSGGKPYHSWPPFLVVTFELTILGGALGGFIGMLVLNGLPRLYHPLFNSECFQLASRDRFFLLIQADDPHYEPERTRQFLEDLKPVHIEEVPP